MVKQQWMWIDWLIFSFRCGWYGTGLIYYSVYSDRLGELPYFTFAILISISLIIPQLFWRPGYVNPPLYSVAELIVSGLFSIYINNILGISLSHSVILMPILMIGYLMNRTTAPWVIPLFVILLPANRYWTIDSQFNFYLQYVDILLFFSIGLGFNLITKSQKRYKLLLAENMKQVNMIQEQNKALKQYALQAQKQAVLEERNRLARDLHDSIGHYFTSITVGLDAASYMMQSNPSLAEEKIHRLAEIAREGLTEVRKTIHQIAPADEDVAVTLKLKKIATEFAEHTDTTIDFNVVGTEPILAAHLKVALVRCLQECLTNAKRHGQAKLIRVTIQFKKEDAILEIFNNGKTLDTTHFGFGLTSMKKRLEELNGTLQVKNQADEGVIVTCTLFLGGNYEIYKTIAR